MFSREVKTLLENANDVISNLMCTLREDFGDVYTVVYNQVYEELRIEEIDKEKFERKVKEEEELDKKMEQKEKEIEEKIENGEKIEEEKEEPNYICFFLHFFIIKFSIDSLQPNKVTAFTSFDTEKDYWYPICKEIQMGKTLENLYYSFGRIYFRYRPDIFDDRIRFLLNNFRLTRPSILLLPGLNEPFLTEKEVNQHNYYKSFLN
jgi:hypothetical protein